MLEKTQAAAAAYLDQLAGRLVQQPAVIHLQVAVGSNVVTAILQEADTANCDLIAISTHGRGGLQRLLWGSVADKVVRSANHAVLVYHPAH
jgi:nucleotide-binding universal stress UspA family protein